MTTVRESAGAPMRLGGWSLYFLAKFLLYWRDLIGFHPLENLAFAAFLAAPIRSQRWRLARTAAAVPLAVILLYYDSRLPAFERLLSQSNLVSSFSGAYLLELAGRFINIEIVALLVLAWAIVRLASRYIRVGVLVMAALAFQAMRVGALEPPVAASAAPKPAAGAAGKDDPDAILRAFHAAEAQRKVALPAPEAGSTPFDIVFLHICSLSWDDLKTSGLDTHPFWQRMDFVFHHFNSASSYSGPAAIRINRALCGQSPHAALYQGASADCYLMPNLRKAGFAPNFAMNHDGHFDDFLQTLRAQGQDAPLQALAGTPMPQRAFDGSPIYDDNAVLSHWIDARGRDASPRVALYYNSISLHDGNRIVNGPNSGLSSAASYKFRLGKLLDDLDMFLQQLQRSGRRVVVMVVPEHGAAIRGDRYQFAGLRDIPTPRITNVPVGVAVIGPDARRTGAQAKVDQPVSYLALSQLMAQMLAKPPFDAAGFAPDQYTEGLLQTRHVTENDAASVVGTENGYLMRQGKDAWEPYPAE
jgi:cellulose synthase operon protein YhjU